MKLTIAYDLPEKIKEANEGYSLKRCLKKGFTLVGINTAIGIPINLCAGAPPEKYLSDLLMYIGIHTATTGIPAVMLKEATQELAELKLTRLVSGLKNINVDIGLDNLLEASTYRTEYDPDFKNRVVEQKKYINVPVNDYWGEREISLCQEHIIGSKEWNLSLRTPQEEKVYTLGMKKMINR